MGTAPVIFVCAHYSVLVGAHLAADGRGPGATSPGTGAVPFRLRQLDVRVFGSAQLRNVAARARGRDAGEARQRQEGW